MQERIWLLEIESLDKNNTPETLRFSSGEYIDDDGNFYEPRIKQPALFTTSAFTGSVIQTGSRTAFGETVLVNTDGGLDYLSDYAVDGRMSTLSLREEDGTITPILLGTVQNLQFDKNTISVRLRDPQAQLELEHPQREYLGNNILPNGVEGVADDLKGLPKPQVFGKVRNAEPYLVNTVLRVYQVHDDFYGESVDIQSVYDRGVLLTLFSTETTLAALLASNPVAGSYSKFNGYIKLGSTAVGQVTCDVDSSTNLLGDVFNVIATQSGYTFNQTDRSFLNTFGEVGIWLRNQTRTSDMFDLLCQGIGAYWYFQRDSSIIRVKQLVSPASPTIEIQDFQIKDISRDSLGAGSNGIPVYKVKLKADKIETVQTDLASGADDIVRNRVLNEFREGVFESTATRTRHPLSEELEIETAFRDINQATSQAQRIQELLGVRRDSVQLTVRLDEETFDALEIGTVVNLTSYKFGYSTSRDLIVLGFTLDARLYRAELELWG